jgi:DegV family protein with EDD domain
VAVRIVTDSACDLPQQLADELGIEIVSLAIRFGSEEFIDRVELGTDEFWTRCSALPVLPETAAPSPGQFEAAYRKLKSEGADGIVVIALSGELSATKQSAVLAARSVADDIRVEIVDSRSVTLGQGMIAVAAARSARDGASIDDIARTATSQAERTRVWGALDTLENLKKGGRIGNAKAMLASVLSIKPIIEIRNGKVEEGGRQRTRSKSLAFLLEKVKADQAQFGTLENLAVVNAKASDVDGFVRDLRALTTGDVVIGQIGAVIGAHAGRGTIGVVYQVPA